MKTIYQDEYRKIIQMLTELRKNQHLTQTQIAKELHKPQSYIAKIEVFERTLDILEFIHLCRVLGAKPSEILIAFEWLGVLSRLMKLER